MLQSRFQGYVRSILYMVLSFLDQIVTGDKSWFHYWMRESKKISKVWKLTEEDALWEFKEQPSTSTRYNFLETERSFVRIPSKRQYCYSWGIFWYLSECDEGHPRKKRRKLVLIHDSKFETLFSIFTEGFCITCNTLKSWFLLSIYIYPGYNITILYILKLLHDCTIKVTVFFE